MTKYVKMPISAHKLLRKKKKFLKRGVFILGKEGKFIEVTDIAQDESAHTLYTEGSMSPYCGVAADFAGFFELER